MSLENSQNILFKLNTIQENIKYLYREQNTFINPPLNKKSIING